MYYYDYRRTVILCVIINVYVTIATIQSHFAKGGSSVKQGPSCKPLVMVLPLTGWYNVQL